MVFYLAESKSSIGRKFCIPFVGVFRCGTHGTCQGKHFGRLDVACRTIVQQRYVFAEKIHPFSVYKSVWYDLGQIDSVVPLPVDPVPK